MDTQSPIIEELYEYLKNLGCCPRCISIFSGESSIDTVINSVNLSTENDCVSVI